jgi:hypothetical protein
MTTTELNAGSKNVWQVDAPDGVTVTPHTNPDGIVTSLDIAIDYTAADLHDPQVGSMLLIHFQGPEPDPLGAPVPGTPTMPVAYPGLAVPTTIEVTNHTGSDLHGYSFNVVDDDFNLKNREPKDLGQAHPDDYAHFHNLTKTSLVDGNGKPNATITLQDPNGHPGAFDAPGKQLPLAAPSWINTDDGTIKAGAIEKLVGIATNGGVTLHSENKPGEFGGSFTFVFFPHQVDPATIDTSSIEKQKLLDSLTNPDLLPPRLVETPPNGPVPLSPPQLDVISPNQPNPDLLPPVKLADNPMTQGPQTPLQPSGTMVSHDLAPLTLMPNT